MRRPLRTHQREVAGIVEAIATGRTNLADILAAVTPGGGKSLLPVIAAARLIAAGVVDRVCWMRCLSWYALLRRSTPPF